jgi:hypothetical protein
VLHHGEVVERGTHRKLREGGGLYDRLYRLQIGAAGGAVRVDPEDAGATDPDLRLRISAAHG